MLLIAVAIWKKKFGGEKLEVSVEKIERRTIVETVSANGKIQPEKEVKISSDVPGEIISLYVKEGDVVEQGNPLLEINPELLVANVDRMEASVNSSKANLSNAKARLAQSKARLIQAELAYNRNMKLNKDGAISQAEFDQSTSNFEVAKAEVDAAQESVKASEFSVRSSQASLKESKENLSRTKIFAPINGTVYSLNVEQGEKVVGTAQMAGTEMLRIANLNNMEVNVEVSESDIVRVSLGDSASIDVDAYIDRTFDGIVTEISNSANDQLGATEQVTTFDVRIKLLPSSYKDLLENKPESFSPFRPGMSASVEIKTNRVDNVLAVPIQSVTLRPDTFKRGTTLASYDREKMLECVFIKEEGKAKKVNVKTGIQDENYIQIIDGDMEGKVITGPYSIISRKLRNGDVVVKVDESKLNADGK